MSCARMLPRTSCKKLWNLLRLCSTDNEAWTTARLASHHVTQLQYEFQQNLVL